MHDIDANTPAPGARKMVGGALYLGLSQALRLLLTVLSTIVIARLLSPDDYGVVAMATPVLALIGMFQDFGFATATIQKRDLSHAESNAMFWLNILASLGIATILVVISPLVAMFYGDVRAGYVTAASAIGILISGLSLQHGALLNRNMRFAALSGIDMANAIATFIVTVTAAFILRSYWALVIGGIAAGILATVLNWRLSNWRPSRKMGLGAARSLVAFGSHLTGFSLLNFLVRNADDVLIARFAGAAQLGLYDRSYKLMMFPLQNINAPLSRLLMPLLSRHQDDAARYREIFVFAIRVVMLTSAPGIVIATVLSDRVMPFLLGQEWAAAGPIFFWLGLTGLVQPIANMTGVLFMSLGRTALMLKWAVWSGVFTLGGFAIALWIEPTAVSIARALFITAAVRLPILFYLAGRNGPVTVGDLWGAQIAPLIGSVAAAWLALQISPSFAIGPLLCMAMPLAYFLAFGGTLITAEGRAMAKRMGAIARDTLETASRRILRRGTREG